MDFPPFFGRPVGWLLVLGPLLTGCTDRLASSPEQVQNQNLQLARHLHRRVNQPDWQGLDTLFAPTVTVRCPAWAGLGRQLTKAQFMACYRRTLFGGRPGQFTIRQVYQSGASHVIVEGTATGPPPDPPRPLCLIYTIEAGHITRVGAYQ